MSWIPIIKNDNTKIISIINIIYDSIKQNTKEMNNPGLLSGKAGICLFLLYYKKINKNIDMSIADIVESAIDDMNNSSFYNLTGMTVFSEICWVIFQLDKDKALNIDLENYFLDLDESLYELGISLLKKDKYDCVNGSINVALYFYNRYINGNIKSKIFLESFVDLLFEKKISEQGAFKWKSEIDHVTHDCGYNLGIAHGIPGILLFLCKLYTLEIKKNKVESLIHGSIKFILSKERTSNDYYSLFSGVCTDADNNKETRLGWCYGDLSVGYSLYKASKLNIKKLEYLNNKSLDIINTTLSRKDLKKDRIYDACICHGTSGIAHIYNRLFQMSNYLPYKEAALFWYEETIKMSCLDPTIQFAGYRTSLVSNYEKEHSIEGNLSFLSGIAGIGLSLISSISSIRPDWDECLLLN